MPNTYTAVTKQDGDWWIGWIEEVPGVNCQERSQKELLATLRASLSEALEFNAKMRSTQPSPAIPKNSSLYETQPIPEGSPCAGVCSHSRREQPLLVFESVFKFHKEGRLYLSWFSLQKEGQKQVDASDHEIDRLHLQYWDECIDRSFKPEDHTHVVSFIPKELKRIMEAMYIS